MDYTDGYFHVLCASDGPRQRRFDSFSKFLEEPNRDAWVIFYLDTKYTSNVHVYVYTHQSAIYI